MAFIIHSYICRICGAFLIIVLPLNQGVLDGGLDIPHSDKRFAGFKKDDKQLDAELHRKYILGGHVASYMRVCHLHLIFILLPLSSF